MNDSLLKVLAASQHSWHSTLNINKHKKQFQDGKHYANGLCGEGLKKKKKKKQQRSSGEREIGQAEKVGLEQQPTTLLQLMDLVWKKAEQKMAPNHNARAGDKRFPIIHKSSFLIRSLIPLELEGNNDGIGCSTVQCIVNQCFALM